MSNCSISDKSESAPGGCGCGRAVVFDGASAGYKRVLRAVIAINLVGCLVVAIGSWWVGSASLAANTLDFGGDAATYALSLWAIGRSVRVRTGAATVKSASLAAMAIVLLALAGWRALTAVQPDGGAISGLGLFGVAANLLAALLLVRFREGDANVRSVWLCTRNDLIQCLAVAATGVAVSVTGSRWPDLLVGVFLAAVFFRSAWQITRQAQAERQAVPATPAVQRDFVTASRRRSAPL